MQATDLCNHWQELLRPYADAFTPRGFPLFTAWRTGRALHVEEHTITQAPIGRGRPQDGRARESFAEYGSWDQDALEHAAAGRIDQAPERLWYGYRVWAGDDTKVHRSSKKVWGTCTFHEYTARCPNRAATVRAHNGVVLGALLPRPSPPALFLWTKAPIVRTTPAQLLLMTLLRLLQFRWEEAAGDRWWLHPPWNKRKVRPSVLDLGRLLWQNRGEIQQLLSAEPGTGESFAGVRRQR